MSKENESSESNTLWDNYGFGKKKAELLVLHVGRCRHI